MEKIPVFLCYRQLDGQPTAKWLYDRLHNQPISTEDADSARLEVYFDQTTPAVSNWKKLQKPALQRAKANLVVCTPLLTKKREPPDRVHEELEWWVRKRKTAPIPIVRPRDDDVYLPDYVRDRWPNCQRVPFDLDAWRTLKGKEQSDLTDAFLKRIRDGIRLSQTGIVFEDLRRFKRLSWGLAASLLLALIFLGAAGYQWNRASNARDAERKRSAELEVVTDFQGSMIGRIDPDTMGLKAKALLRDLVVDGLESRNVPEDERADHLDAFDFAVRYANGTTFASRMLGDNILEPAAQAIDKDFVDQRLVQAALQQTVANTYIHIGLYAAALPLQEAALNTRREELLNDHRDTLNSINNMGTLLESLGNFEEAMPHLREALDTRRRELGDDHPDTLTSINNMGALLNSMGKSEEAILHYREALETSRRLLADDHPIRLTSTNNMGSLLRSMGEYAEAMPYCREALKTSRRVLGDDHPSTLTSINNMGGLLSSLGKSDEAMPYYREALATSRRVLGDDHPNTLASINNMGFLLNSRGKSEEAMPYYSEALARMRRVLGDDHPNTLISINNMGTLLESMGEYEEAVPHYSEALDKMRRVLGDDHPHTLALVNNMGALLKSMGNYEQAMPYYHESLEARRRVLGNYHPDTLGSINAMGELQQLIGKYEKAMPYYREALKKRRRVLGDDHPNTLVSINNTGTLLKAMGKYEAAMPYLHEALHTSRRVLGDDHPDTLGFMNNMGALLKSMGKYDKAQPYYREALERIRRVHGGDHPVTLNSINNMGTFLESVGKYEEAVPYLREALNTSRRVLGDDHPDTLGAMNNMGALLKSMGKLEEAMPYFREGLERMRCVLGDDHPSTLISIHQVGALLLSMGKYEEAMPYSREALEKRRLVEGDDHPNTLVSIDNMAELMRESGRLDEAEAFGAEAVQRARQSLPQGHWYVGTFLKGHGITLWKLERYADAEAALLEASAITNAALGKDHERTVSSIGALADFYAAWHEADRDQGYDAKAADWRAKLPAAERASSLIELGVRRLEGGQYAEAEAPLGECLEIRREALAQGHWLIFNTMSVLGESLAGQGGDRSLTVASRIEKLREAAPLLLEGYDGVTCAADMIPVQVRDQRISEAIQRIVKLYEAWHAAEPGKGYDAKAAEWRTKLPDNDPK